MVHGGIKLINLLTSLSYIDCVRVKEMERVEVMDAYACYTNISNIMGEYISNTTKYAQTHLLIKFCFLNSKFHCTFGNILNK